MSFFLVAQLNFIQLLDKNRQYITELAITKAVNSFMSIIANSIINNITNTNFSFGED